MALKLYLIRHGETGYNVNGSDEFGQPSDIPLNDIGILQSKKLAKRLKRIRFDKIFISDMARAKQTTEIVCKEINRPFVEDKRLREYQHGSVKPSSEKWVEKYKEILKSGMSKYDIRPFGGENIWDLIKRVRSFLNDLEKEIGTIAITSHSGVNAALINISQRRQKDEFLPIKQDNVCINVLEFDGQEWNINVINDSSHISEIFPNKEKYQNQNEIREQAKTYVLEKFKDFVDELYFAGDIINDNFSTYDRPYKRYKGSTLEIYGKLKEDFKIPINWKISILNGKIKKYEVGKIKINDIRHKVNLTIINSGSDIAGINKERII